MPNLITHIWFGEEVLKSLPKELGDRIALHKDAYILGNLGPDFMYAIREIGLPTGNYPNELHHNRQHVTFEAIAKYLRETDTPEAFSYAMGLMCHYVADKNVHPYVNALCEGFVSVALSGEELPTAHGFIESAIDTYIITDRMGIANPNEYLPNKALKSKYKTRKAIAEMYMACVDGIHNRKLTPFMASLSFQLTKLFLWFANDKTGLKHPFVRKLEKALMGGSMQVTALMRPPVKYDKIDYLNFEHRPYRAIRNKDEMVNYDAMQVIDMALDQSINYYVPELYKAVAEDKQLDVNDFLINYEGVEAGN
ncbi:MAG: zinc dependent phospholipase C family protein [Clostridia bacterium]|nr:zinc dependent phospholipase C family protein [Clostridia bacterium]